MIDQPQGEKPALTVVIQSWWTPAVALIFLVVGLLGGYFGRPLVNKGLGPDWKRCCSGDTRHVSSNHSECHSDRHRGSCPSQAIDG